MKIGIMGLGLTGYAVADYVLSDGKDEVFISESRPLEGDVKKHYATLRRKYGDISAEFGGHTKRLVDFSDIIVKSPGISAHSNSILFEKAAASGVPIVGELDFVFSRIKSRPSRIIAVTGTNGKTTTTALIGHILKNSPSFSGDKKKVVVCGNIGLPLAAVAGRINLDTTLVVEVSSYQLEDAREFYPDIGLILNITPDHLEHHETMASYIEAKSKIFTLQKSNAPKSNRKKYYCILNYDDNICRKLSKKVAPPTEVAFFAKEKLSGRFVGVWYEKPGRYVFNIGGKKFTPTREVVEMKPLIPGMHNIQNILAACAAVKLADNKIRLQDIKNSVESFRGVPHRLEFVRRINGVDYINDSKATNVDSTRVALESYPDGKVWLILGGRDKGAPYSPLKNLISRRVKGLLLIGEAAKKIHSELSSAADLIFDCGDLKTAVRKARSLALRGDVVLLSPACASFDQFKNFEHRGETFKKIVMSL